MTAPCPVCGGDAGARPPLPAAATAGHDLRRCAGCGFVFVASPPGPLHGRPPGPFGDPTSAARRAMAGLRFAALHRWLRRLHPAPGGRVLDVGAGLGDLALYLMRRGFEVWACDPADDAARSCGALLGDRFLPAGLLEADLPEAFFDVVLLNFCLEHMEDPAAAVATVRRALRPGGVALLRVPNVDAALRGRLGGGFQLQLDHHRSLFGPRSLERLLTGAGLELLEIGTPLSLLEGVSAACQLLPALDSERWVHRPSAPGALLRAAALAVVAGLALPWAWPRCRRGEGVVLHAAARRPAQP